MLFVVSLFMQVCVLAAINMTATPTTTPTTTVSLTTTGSTSTVQSTQSMTQSMTVSSSQSSAQNTTQNTVQNTTQNTTQNTVQNTTQNATQNTVQNTTQNTAQNTTASGSTLTPTVPPVVATSSTVAPPLTTTTAAPAATIQGSFRMTVTNPAAFCADPVVQDVMTHTVAVIANVSAGYVHVVLTPTARRLSATAGPRLRDGAGLRRLTSGSVTTAYTITVPADAGNSGSPLPNVDDVQDALTSVNTTTLTDFVNLALLAQLPNSTFGVVVTDIVAATTVLAATTTTLLRQAMANGARHATAAIGLGAAAALAALLVH